MTRSSWILVVMFVMMAVAQTPTATLIGVVTDPAGLTVADATAVVRNTGTGEVQRTKSGARGLFTVTNLPQGFYDVRVEKTGFRTLNQTGIELLLDQAVRLQFAMEIGAVTQEVTVAATAPLINTENGVRGGVIEKFELTEMPLQGRNFLDLAYLIPGVSTGLPSISYSGVVTNGSRSDNVGMIVDGTPSRDLIGAGLVAPVNLEAVAEFKMATNNYSAEYGKVSGGVMSLVVKGGTNQVHGSAFLFSRDAIFDARSYFSPTKGDMLRNQFGGSVGGPLFIPKLYNGKNKTFFMVSLELLRQNAPYNALLTVPSDLERTGDFSKSLTNVGAKVALKDPLAGNTLFSNAIIPATRLDPIAQKLMKYYPEPGRAGTANNYAEALQQGQRYYYLTSKMDEAISTNNRLSVNFSRNHTDNKNTIQSGYAPTFAADMFNESTVGGLSITHIFTPQLIMELRSGISRLYNSYGVQFAGQNIAQQLGIQGTTTDAGLWAFPSFQVTGYATVGDYAANPGFRLSNTLTDAGTLTWVKGKHVVKTGADTSYGNVNNYRPSNANGLFRFLGNWTSNSFADFALGYLDSSSLTPTSSPQYLLVHNYAAFVQDDYKIHPRLTLNIGLRYDISQPPLEKRGRWSNYEPSLQQVVISGDQTLPNLANQLAAAKLTGKVVLAKDVGRPEALAYTPLKDFAPRAGLAWRPFGGTKTSIRAGWGIYYGTNYLGPFLTFFGQGYPFQVNQTFARNTTNPLALTLQNPFPSAIANLGATTNTNGMEWHIRSPYVQNFNFTVERELPGGFAAEAAYSGSTGTHLTRGININAPYYYQPALWGPNNTITRPNSTWATINFITEGSSSNFHAGLITIKRRLAHSFMMRFNYQFSKSIDDATDYNVSVDPITDPRYARIDRGVSDNNQRHLASFSFLYQSPLRSRIGRNWQLAGTGRMGSGFPFSPQTQNANQSLGQSPRPDRLRNGGLEKPTPALWFDVTAFTNVPNGAFRPGTAGRNILVGPGYEAVNLSFSRNFLFKEGNRLQIRVEAFNALNHGNFNQPSPYINAVGGGSIASAQATRSMQLGARYEY